MNEKINLLKIELVLKKTKNELERCLKVIFEKIIHNNS